MERLGGNAGFISIVVPVYNEQEVLGFFYKRVIKILSSENNHDFEIIFVNDGSKDQSLERIMSLHLQDPRVKLIDLSRNFGKEIAMTAGLDFAQGDAVIVIDADLQDPPELIPEMLKKWREGFDVVYATRICRDGETWLKRLTANLFYLVIGSLTRIEIPKNTGDFRLLSRRVVDALKLLREKRRFMKGLFSWVGFNQTSISYRRQPRQAGRTKWNYWKLWNFAIEGITSLSSFPLQIASYVGITVASLSFLYAIFLVCRTLISGVDVPGYASLMVAILFFSGLQLLFLGVMGEYIGRLLDEAKSRPLYLAQDTIGFSKEDKGDVSQAKTAPIPKRRAPIRLGPRPLD